MSNDSLETAMSPPVIIRYSITSSTDGRLFWSYYC